TDTLDDTTPPAIGQAGADATIECTRTPSFPAPTATHVPYTTIFRHLSDVTLTSGCTKTITRTWDATDACNNHSATRTQTITIVDTRQRTIVHSRADGMI